MDVDGIWRAFSRDLKGHLQRKVPAQDAEDLLQEIFLALLRNPAPEGVPIAAWVWSLVRNHVANYYRQRKDEGPPLEAEWVAVSTGEVTQAEAWVATWLEGYVSALPEPYGEAVLLADFQGHGMKEVALRQGVSLSGAKSRVQRGRVKLAEALKSCCAFYFDEQGRIESWKKHESGSCPPDAC